MKEYTVQYMNVTSHGFTRYMSQIARYLVESTAPLPTPQTTGVGAAKSALKFHVFVDSLSVSDVKQISRAGSCRLLILFLGFQFQTDPLKSFRAVDGATLTC